ncbi:MAG TPA: LemA family protein [Chryseosolibacter sp.]|nr:LemA family protein [Chryseosolibacter sp.]
MNPRVFHSQFVLLAFSLILFCSCEKRNDRDTSFTKADSLTGTYLALQDTMLQAWNAMIHDDNRKIKAMNDLVGELIVSFPEKRDELKALEVRLEHLNAMRYDQNTMADPEMVTEYDFASNSLVTELIALAEAQKEFAYNSAFQGLVDTIRAADQRVNNYREEYDEIASRFNAFIESNKDMLTDIKSDSGLEKKPLFEMAAESQP